MPGRPRGSVGSMRSSPAAARSTVRSSWPTRRVVAPARPADRQGSGRARIRRRPGREPADRVRVLSAIDPELRDDTSKVYAGSSSGIIPIDAGASLRERPVSFAIPRRDRKRRAVSIRTADRYVEPVERVNVTDREGLHGVKVAEFGRRPNRPRPLRVGTRFGRGRCLGRRWRARGSSQLICGPSGLRITIGNSAGSVDALTEIVTA